MASEFCSAECSKKSSRTKDRRKSTIESRYGVSNLFSVPGYAATCFSNKHGVDNPMQIPEFQKKISHANKLNSADRISKMKKTNLTKYGVPHPGQSQQVKDQIKRTCLDKYGQSAWLKTHEFQTQSAATKKEKYGTDNTSSLESVKQKIKNTKQQKYGNDKFNNSEQTKQTMLDRYGCHSSRSHWSDTTLQVLEDRDQLNEFVTNKTINNAAQLLGVAPTTLRNILIEYGIVSYDARKNQYEALVKEFLEQNSIVYQQSNRTVLSGQELDFYCPEHNLAIELNGIFWHSETMGKDRNYHLRKTTRCEEQGIRLIQFWDYQFDKSPEIVFGILRNALKLAQRRIFARNTQAAIITSTQAREFMNHNHLQGATVSAHNFGLWADSELVAVMSFGKSRFAATEFELIRFAVKTGCSVVGGASKLLKFFLDKTPDINTIISYADRNISQGNLYKVLGFKQVSITSPSYLYFQNRIVYNRIQFQKHKLKKLLKNFDATLSEWENMKRNGYNRCWNTGNIKYEFNR